MILISISKSQKGVIQQKFCMNLSLKSHNGCKLSLSSLYYSQIDLLSKDKRKHETNNMMKDEFD